MFGDLKLKLKRKELGRCRGSDRDRRAAAEVRALTVYTERRWAIDGVWFIHCTFTFKLTQSNQYWGRYTRRFAVRAAAARAAMPPAPPPAAHKVPSRRDRCSTLHECLLAVLNKTLSSEQKVSMYFQLNVGTGRFH